MELREREMHRDQSCELQLREAASLWLHCREGAAGINTLFSLSRLELLAQLSDELGPKLQEHPLRTVVVFQTLGLATEQSQALISLRSSQYFPFFRAQPTGKMASSSAGRIGVRFRI